MIEFKISNVVVSGHPAQLLEFDLGENGSILPREIPGAIASLPPIEGTKGVVISGRGPVWLFGALLHHCHTTRWAATFDPRQGAVIVSSHHPDAPKAGEVLPLPK